MQFFYTEKIHIHFFNVWIINFFLLVDSIFCTISDTLITYRDNDDELEKTAPGQPMTISLLCFYLFLNTSTQKNWSKFIKLKIISRLILNSLSGIYWLKGKTYANSTIYDIFNRKLHSIRYEENELNVMKCDHVVESGRESERETRAKNEVWPIAIRFR